MKESFVPRFGSRRFDERADGKCQLREVNFSSFPSLFYTRENANPSVDDSIRIDEAITSFNPRLNVVVHFSV